MFSRFRFAAIVAAALLLGACGGSGGSGQGVSGGESDCGGSNCGGAVTATPVPAPPPTGTPVAAVPLSCGGSDRSACPDGYHCVADPTVACDAATGVACDGICALGDALPPCRVGSADTCPVGYACVDDPAADCAGSPPAACPGVCRPVAHDPCADDAGCAMLDSLCRVCADGSLRCSEPRCVNGDCRVDADPCATVPTCGGITGLPCADGYQCIDDPADDCAPERGGVDCGGICIPESKPPTCGGITGATCPSGLECVDDANDMCEPETGADCPGTCQPSQGDECASDADCPLLRAPCYSCADGTAACPRSVCEDGRCAFDFPTCTPPSGCRTDADCSNGQSCVLPPDAVCDPSTGAPDCGGVCVASGPPTCGGEDGTPCPDGFVCVGADGASCQADANGNGCAGVCVPAPPPGCRSADDCGDPDSCTSCPDGSTACPKSQCLDGVCILEPPLCGRGECTSDADCAVIQVCRTCPDGAYACPRAQCRNGTCDALYPGCPQPAACGGIAGVPCPMGYTCVDRPDGCDPEQGGQDCAGVCQREDGPRSCGGVSGAACPEGYECVAGLDGCPPGAADCPGICRPKPSPMCASDADCPALGAPCRLCVDGTSACPRSFCSDGQCRIDLPACQTAGM